MGARRVLPLILCLGLVGCGGNTLSPSPTSRAVIATAVPTLTLTPTATPLGPTPTPLAPTSTPKATALPTLKPTPKPPPTWTKAERAIRDAIRADIRVACAPRRLDLPPRTIAAVECRPGKDPVSSVGFYLFAKGLDALDVYMTRIYDAGLVPDSDLARGWEHLTYFCNRDKIATTLDCRNREAAFGNREGYANYRTVRGRMYIGVLGTGNDLANLVEWAWAGSGAEGAGGAIRLPAFQTLWCGGSAPSATGALCAP